VSGIEGLALPADLQSYLFDEEGRCPDLSPGEAGCYASHLAVFQAICEHKIPRALVLEDDARFDPGLMKKVTAFADNAPPDWDLIHLCGGTDRAFKTLVTVPDAGALILHSRIPAGAAGYLITLAGAKKMLVPRRRHWPIDTDFRQPWHFGLLVYGIVPPLIGHDEHHSTIGAAKTRARRRRGLPVPSKTTWTGNPLHSPHGMLFNIKRLGIVNWLTCFVFNTRRRAIKMLRPLAW
jgi:glycosyl transferase family 25